MTHKPLFLATLSALSACTGVLFADCTSPAAAAGEMYYDSVDNVINFCNGTNWQMTGKDVPAAGTSGCSSPTGTEGNIIYNSTYNVVQFCNGDDWVSMGPEDNTIATTACTSPAGNEGSLIYSSTANWLQYCNGQDWVNAGQLYLAAEPSIASWAAAAALSKVTASDPGDYSQFGTAVSLDNGTAAVTLGNGREGVYMFTQSGSTWSQQEKISNPSMDPSDFGASVAVSGDTVVIGAPLFMDQMTYWDMMAPVGGIYVFTRIGGVWGQEALRIANDWNDFDYFGASVAIDGDTIVVGAPYSSPSWNAHGSAYVLTRSGSTWSQQQKLEPSDAAANNEFGGSVSIDGDTIVVGATQKNANGTGVAYVFTRSGSTWTQQQKLTASDGAADDLFGNAVDISGDTVLIGASADDDNGDGSGSAYVFTRSGSTWTQQQKLTADDGAALDQFGLKVSIDGDTALIGSPLNDGSDSDFGSAYVFTRSGSTWTQVANIMPADGAKEAIFGGAVALDNDTALIAAPQDGEAAEMGGSAYFFAPQ